MKKLGKVALVLAVFVGIIGVCAATQTLFTDNSYRLAKGGASVTSGLKSNYDYVEADVFVQNLVSSTSRSGDQTMGSAQGTTTVFKLYKTNSSGALTLVSNVSTPLIKLTSKIVALGKPGKGTLSILNQAFSGSTDYDGYSGALKYYSHS